MKHLISLAIVFLLLSCENDDQPGLIPAGIETRISGHITSINGESLSDVEIRIGEYVQTTSGGCYSCPAPTNSNEEFKNWAKTINLSPNGDFDFTFQTSGAGNFYKLFVGSNPEPWVGQGTIPFFVQQVDNPIVVNLTTEANDRSIIGKEYSLNSALRKLYLCEVNVQFNLTSSYPIEPVHLYTYASNNKMITTFTNPTTINLFIDKADPQTLILERNRDNGVRQRATYTFEASHVEQPTVQNITVNEEDFIDY